MNALELITQTTIIGGKMQQLAGATSVESVPDAMSPYETITYTPDGIVERAYNQRVLRMGLDVDNKKLVIVLARPKRDLKWAVSHWPTILFIIGLMGASLGLGLAIGKEDPTKFDEGKAVGVAYQSWFCDHPEFDGVQS